MTQATGTMNQLQQQIDMIGHNMANSNTPGYKERHAEFANILSQQINNLTPSNQAGPRLTPDGIRQGIGSRLGAIHSNDQIGSLEETGRALDSALLQPNHYYQVQVERNGEQEVQYTRDGSFYLQPVGNGDDMMLVTKDGHPVYGDNGIIQFSTANVDHLQIANNGDIIVQRAGQNEVVGSIAIAQISLSNVLETTGDNLFRLTDMEALGLNQNEIVQTVPTGANLVKGGALEMSNVSIQEQMTQLINAQRAYQFNARSVTMSDQMLGLVNQLR